MPQEPSKLLQLPSSTVIENIRDLWRLTKKPANIYLVVDVSGSMEGEKLAGAKRAIYSFVSQIQGNRDQLAIIAFSTEFRLVEDLSVMSAEKRTRIQARVASLNAGGGTLLYDAIKIAEDQLKEKSNNDFTNVIVAMTDGQSEGSISELENAISSSELDLHIFTVAYGDDADGTVLQSIARLGNGYAYPSDPSTIDQLYEQLSTFF